jgi:hypothetical protein
LFRKQQVYGNVSDFDGGQRIFYAFWSHGVCDYRMGVQLKVAMVQLNYVRWGEGIKSDYNKMQTRILIFYQSL